MFRRRLFIVLVSAFVSSVAISADDKKAMTGQELAFSTAKGNCLACHQMPSDPAAITSANIGPPLIMMKERFPDRARLRAQIWDATAFNSETVMPHSVSIRFLPKLKLIK